MEEPEPIPEPEPEPTPEPEPEPEEEPEAEPLSQDDLDNLFGEEDTSPEPIESMIDGNIDDEEAETIEVEDDDLLDDDPIPEVFNELLPDDDDELPIGRPRFKNPPPDKKANIGVIIGSVVGVVLLVSIGTAIAMKDTVISAVPAAKDYYTMLGLYHVEPGEGLSHQDVKARRDVKNATDYLIVEGNVVNITDAPIAVPLLKVALTNNKGKEIRVLTHELSKTQLEPGESISFKVEFEDPPGTARSMALGFVEPEQGDGDEAD